jgi:hypothetical protein
LYADTGVPDLAGSDLNVSYNHGTTVFQAKGYVSGYVTSGGDTLGVAGFSEDFNLTANISNAGDFLGGTFTATGDLEGGPGREVLLTATLGAGAKGTIFDYSSDGGQFGFLFTVTGGSLAGDFGGLNAYGVMELFPWVYDSPTFSDWTSNFSNTGGGMADCFPTTVPEPSSAVLLLAVGALWSAVRSRR